MTTYPLRTEAMDAAIRQRYGTESGVPDTIPMLSRRILAEAAAQGRPVITRIPSAFIRTDNDPFEPVPQYRFPEWRSLGEHYKFFKAEGGVFLLAPELWQFGYPFHLHARQYGLFVARESFTNVPLAAEIIRQARPSFVVAHAMDLSKLRDELREQTVGTVVAFFGADELPADDIAALPGAQTMLDIHLFPGHSIAHQSFPLIGSRDVFHLDQRYLWEFEDDGSYVTGIDMSVLPVYRYRVPFSCAPAETMSRVPAFTLTPC